MDSKKFIQLLTEVIRKEVRAAVKEEISSIFEERVSNSNNIKKTVSTPLQKNVQKTIQKNICYSKDPVMNKILKETANAHGEPESQDYNDFEPWKDITPVRTAASVMQIEPGNEIKSPHIQKPVVSLENEIMNDMTSFDDNSNMIDNESIPSLSNMPDFLKTAIGKAKKAVEKSQSNLGYRP